LVPRSGSWSRWLRASWAPGAVGVLAGLLFATNAGVFAEASDRQPLDLRDLVRDENERMNLSADEVSELRSQIEELIDAQAPTTATAEQSSGVDVVAGRGDWHGPGVRVQLWDAPYDEAPEDFGPDDLVVHQQDIEAVLNGLRAGGAEAIAVQGHRVTSTTAIRCVGNVLLLAGQTYSPPYEITAIGDPERLAQSVMAQRPVQVYLQYVEAIQLGWSFEVEDDLTIRGMDGNPTLEYARVPGHEPFIPPGETPPPFPAPEPE